jgi:hypothetical protein
MIRAKAKVKLDGKKVIDAARKGSIQSLGHAGAAIRLAARHSIRKSPKPSPSGTPPHTRKGRIRNAIKYAVMAASQAVLIGPDAEIVGTSGKAHEFGGHFRRENYDRRPFMGPALQRTKDRLPSFWAASVKG